MSDGRGGVCEADRGISCSLSEMTCEVDFEDSPEEMLTAGFRLDDGDVFGFRRD